MYDLNLPDDFYRNGVLEEEYNRRTIMYRDIHNELYPSMHSSELKRENILSQIRPMVRAELELEKYDRQIGNDFDSNAWVDRTRKTVRDAVARSMSALMLTPKQIYRVLGVTEESKGFIEMLTAVPDTDYVE